MNNPHDRFCKETLTRKENAVSFFREHLPQDVAGRADWRTLTIVKETFISPDLKERFSDIVYTVRVKGLLVFLYLLFEHQSTIDVLMPLRFYQYMGDIWGLFIKQNPGETRLPEIVPILFYHGENPWNISPKFEDMIVEPALMPACRPRFEHVVRDLSAFSDSEIKGNVSIRLFLSVMRRIFSPNFSEHLDGMLPLFAELSRKRTGMQYLETVLRYIYNVRDDIDPEETEKKLIQVIDEDNKEGVMTVAERLRQEGEVRGKIQLWQELLANGLLPKDMVEQKITQLNRELEKLTKKSTTYSEH
jgi:predicted transposase/invertase (TIGR01784 family)